MRKTIITPIIVTALLLSMNFSSIAKVYAEDGVESRNTQLVVDAINTDSDGVNTDKENEPLGATSVQGQVQGYNTIQSDLQKPEITTGQAIDIPTSQIEESTQSGVDEIYKPIQYIINVTANDTDGNVIKSYQLQKECAGVYNIQPEIIEGYEVISKPEDIELIKDNSIKSIVFKYKKTELQIKVAYRDRIYDAKTGKGIEGVEVTAIGKADSEEINCLTDSDGYFELKLTAGDYILKLVRKGYKEQTVDIKINN